MPGKTTVDDYIRSAPTHVQPVLEAMRATVRKAAPDAEERISYRMPAYFQHGVLAYFAAFKSHVGFYPPVRDKALLRQAARYAGPKGNLRFPLAGPMPHALVAKLVKARLKENLPKQGSKQAAKRKRRA